MKKKSSRNLSVHASLLLVRNFQRRLIRLERKKLLGSRKHPTPEEKKKLDNKKVPNLTLHKAAKETLAGNPKEGDRLWNLIKEHEKKKKP